MRLRVSIFKKFFNEFICVSPISYFYSEIFEKTCFEIFESPFFSGDYKHANY